MIAGPISQQSTPEQMGRVESPSPPPPPPLSFSPLDRWRARSIPLPHRGDSCWPGGGLRGPPHLSPRLPSTLDPQLSLADRSITWSQEVRVFGGQAVVGCPCSSIHRHRYTPSQVQPPLRGERGKAAVGLSGS